MHPNDFRDQLSRVASSDDMLSNQYGLTDEWIAAGIGLESVEPILRFMEDHPELDLGTPGPLVHFVERFYGKGYESKLVASVPRKPTSHTLWMLNRLINGTDEGEERRRLVDLMEGVRQTQSQRALGD
jgi:hypothetical protein